MNPESFRRANIGIAAGAIVAVAGAVAFGRSNEAALELVGLAAFVVALGVYLVLDERALRKNKKDFQ